MLEHLSVIANRRRQGTRSSWRSGLALVVALSLPTGIAWAQGNGNGNAFGWDNSHNPHYGGDPQPQASAPEIDASVAVSALAILTGGILLAGDRLRKSRRNREG